MAEEWDWGGVVPVEELMDEGKMRSRFKAFGADRGDDNYRKRLEWWVSVVHGTCRSRGFFALDTDELLERWFRWQGVRPLGMGMVLEEMLRRGDLSPAEGLLRAASGGREGWAQWGWRHLSSVWSGQSAGGFGGRLVVVAQLRELARAAEQALRRDAPPAGVATMKEVEAACAGAGGEEGARLVIGFLCQEGRARVVSCKAGLGVQLVGEGGEVGEAQGVLDVKLAAEVLEARVGRMEVQMGAATDRARAALRDGQRPAARRHLATRKMLEKAHTDAAAALSGLEGVLLQVQAAEGTKQTVAALQAGARALREANTSILEGGQLEEIDVARQDAEELGRRIGQAMQPSRGTDRELEEEYAQLLAEDGDDTVAQMHALPQPPQGLPTVSVQQPVVGTKNSAFVPV